MLLTVFNHYIFFIVISIIAFTLIVGFILYKFGLIDSISSSFYLLPDKYKDYFTYGLWLFSVPIMVASTSFWQFMSGLGICYVGAAAAYKQSIVGKVHVFGVLTSIVSGLVHLTLSGYIFTVPLYLVIIIPIMNYVKKGRVFIVEIVSFYYIAGLMLIYSLKSF